MSALPDHARARCLGQGLCVVKPMTYTAIGQCRDEVDPRRSSGSSPSDQTRLGRERTLADLRLAPDTGSPRS